MRAPLRRMTFEVGDRVRLKPDAPLARLHPGLAGAVGIIRSVVHGPQWSRLGSSPTERAADLAMHVRFLAPINLVALNIEAEQIERVELPIR